MTKRIVSFVLIMCVCLSLFVFAGAVRFDPNFNSHLNVKYHYVPILKDSATGYMGLPYWDSYNSISSLYSQVTVTAYNNSTSETATQNCYDDTAVLEGWSEYTSATAKIRAITSATANFLLGADTGTARQIASWTK